VIPEIEVRLARLQNGQDASIKTISAPMIETGRASAADGQNNFHFMVSTALWLTEFKGSMIMQFHSRASYNE
jgi:hypothetical protein